MRCTIVAALAAIAAAQTPAQPVWPKEFKANITETDLQANHSQSYYQLYSYSNNAVQNDHTDYHRQDTAQIEDFQDWKNHRVYNIYTPQQGQANCHSQPLQGEIFVPPVATLVYNGTEPAGKNWPVATYRWVGTQHSRDDFHYHTTANAAELPVGFFDFGRQVKTYFSTFTVVQPNAWPANQWAVPTICH